MYFASEHPGKGGNFFYLYFHQCELKHRKAKASLYSENRHTATSHQTQPQARHSPKAIQLCSRSWEPSAGLSWEEDVSGNWVVSWLPNCSCVMAPKDKIWTENGLDCLALGQQHVRLGFPNHPGSLWRIWDSGKPCAVEGNSTHMCVHWKSRECIF